MSTSEPAPHADEPTSFAPAEEGPLAHVGALVLLDGPVHRADLLRAVSRAVRAHAALRSRPVRLPLAADLLAWVPEPDFRVARHVRQVDAGERDGTARVASALWSQPLPFDRPPWRVDLLAGPDDAGTAVLVRGHAALAPDHDGAALAAMLLATQESPHTPPVRAHVAGTGAPPERAREQRDDDVGTREPRTTAGAAAATGAPSALPGLLDFAIALAERGAHRSQKLASEVRGLLRPATALARTREIGRVLESASTLLSSPAPETPWNGRLGCERSLAWTTLPLAPLRRSGTWYDAWLALVGDALGRLLRDRGRDTTGLTLLAHVRTHARDAEDVAASLVVGLPAGDVPAAARVAAVRQSRLDPVAAARGEGLARLASVAERLPEPLRSLLGSLSYQAANVVLASHAAPRSPLVVAGRSASVVVPLASLPWHVGLVLATLVADDALVVGVTADAGTIRSAELVTRALHAAHAELAGGAPGDAPPTIETCA